MSNPRVRPHLSFYPEDSGPVLSEARQGRRWLHEIPDEQITPMARIGDQDYFIHEPAMLDDQTCCIPVRWFTKDNILFAECWELDTITTDTTQAWRVLKRNGYVVPQHRFLKNLPNFLQDAALYGLPDPSNILGVYLFNIHIQLY